MKIFLDKLLNFKGNKYILSKATMYALDKVVNMKGYVEEKKDKTATKILELVLDKKINYDLVKEIKED